MLKLPSFLLALLWCLSSFAYTDTFERYFRDTYIGIEAMRDARTGLVSDVASAELVTTNDNTSPTNIALDLLVQLEAMKRGVYESQAKLNITHILQTLTQLDYHQESGLFYERYRSIDHSVTHVYVSAIDNMHLAFALWTISETYFSQEEREIARKLFSRMDFSFLYDDAKGLFAGGAFYKNQKWFLELYRFDYFGSEARSLYTIGWAIGLIKDVNFLEKFKRSIMIEMNGPMLRAWDGGAFQMLLPRLLANEELYSASLQKSFSAYAQFVIEKGKQDLLPVPASYSACQTSLSKYNGKAGTPELVATINRDLDDEVMRVHWDEVFTPHAAFLAAPMLPEIFEQIFLSAERIGSNRDLYVPGLGWMDGLHVRGDSAGVVVPMFLSLDQGMIALSSAQIVSPNHMLTGSEALARNPVTHERIQKVFDAIEGRLIQN